MPDPRSTASPRPPAPPQAPPPSALVDSSSAQAQLGPRFSLRFLLIVTTVVAVTVPLLMFLGVTPSGLVVAVLMVAFMHLPLVCIGALAIYCRGSRQAFWFGALAGWLLWLYSGGGGALSAQSFSSRTGVAIILLALLQLVTAAACGYAALATRRFVIRRGWNGPDRDKARHDP
jgi:hypothetical protein